MNEKYKHIHKVNKYESTDLCAGPYRDTDRSVSKSHTAKGTVNQRTSKNRKPQK